MRVILFFLALLMAATPSGEAQSPPDKTPPGETSPGDAQTGDATADATPETTPEQGKTSEPGFALPYPLGEEIEYVRVRAGNEISRSRYRVDAITEGTGRYRITREMDFDAPGRSFRLDGEAILDARWQPITYKQDIATVANQMIGLTRLQARFDEGFAVVTFQAPGTEHPEPHDKEAELPDPVYLYEKHSFFVLIAPILHSGGTGSYDLFCPYDVKTYRTQCTRVRKETKDGRTLWRWKISSPQYSANLWMTEDGALERYHQGPVEVVRVRQSTKPQGKKPSRPRAESRPASRDKTTTGEG